MTAQNQNFTRDDFMDFFRDDEKLATLSNDDRLEIFMSIVPGSSDFTKSLLDSLLADCGVDHLKVIEIDAE